MGDNSESFSERSEKIRDKMFNALDKHANAQMELIIYGKEGKEMDILKYDSIRHMIDWAYRLHVGRKGLKPIEQIAEADKWFYWDKAKRLGLEREETIKAAKCLYFCDYKASYYGS